MTFRLPRSASDLAPHHRRPEVWVVAGWLQPNPCNPNGMNPLQMSSLAVAAVCDRRGFVGYSSSISMHRTSFTGFCGGLMKSLSPSKFHFRSSLVIFGNLWSSPNPCAPYLGAGPVDSLRHGARRLAINQRRMSRRLGPAVSAVLCQMPNYIFSPYAPARPIPAGIGVIRDPAGGSFGGGESPLQSARQWLCRNVIASAFKLRTRPCALSGRGLNRQRRLEESPIGPWIFILQSLRQKLLKGLILLGDRVDNDRSQPLLFKFTVGDHAAFITSSLSGADQSSGSSHENDSVFMSSRVQMPAAGWKIFSSFFAHFTLAVSTSFRPA